MHDIDAVALPPAAAMLMDLPPEIHGEIVSYLPYPDALALKHTSSYFYSLVRTGPGQRVDWIMDRRKLRLPVPMKTCVLLTDETFCKGEVRSIMEKRRLHLECKPGIGGCAVVEGSSCGGGRTSYLLKRSRLVFRRHRKIFVENQAWLFGLVFLILAFIWMPTADMPFITTTAKVWKLSPPA